MSRHGPKATQTSGYSQWRRCHSLPHGSRIQNSKHTNPLSLARLSHARRRCQINAGPRTSIITSATVKKKRDAQPGNSTPRFTNSSLKQLLPNIRMLL